jgi:hypothetical protein
MKEMLDALTKGLLSLAHPRMLWLVVWPLLAALLVWGALAFLYWGEVVGWIQAELARYEWTAWSFPWAIVGAVLGWLLLLLVFVPLVLVTSVFIIGVAAMPAIVRHVAGRDYAGLERREGGSTVGSVTNAVAALLWFLLLVLASLPLWLVPPLWPLLPLLLLGFLNQRVFRYDALAEHASRSELRELIRKWRGEMFVLGVVLALVGQLPFVGLLMPVYAGLVFVHYCLARLREMRGAPVAATA